jgi:hypothetical protein
MVGDEVRALVASFRASQTILAQFLPAELGFVCTESATARAVSGADWLVILTDGAAADAVATALGGTVAPQTCSG